MQLRDRPAALALFSACQRLGSILAQFVDGELSEHFSMSAVHAVPGRRAAAASGRAKSRQCEIQQGNTGR